MSTVIANLPQEKPGFLHARSTGTDFSSTEKPRMYPRSPRQPDAITNHNKVREDLKLCWSGVVISVNKQELTVRMEDMINRNNPDELVVLSRDEIDDKDQSLVVPGALFYWNIGYRQGVKSPKERFSMIRFRRLPKWTAKEIKDAETQAKEYADFFLTA